MILCIECLKIVKNKMVTPCTNVGMRLNDYQYKEISLLNSLVAFWDKGFWSVYQRLLESYGKSIIGLSKNKMNLIGFETI